MRLQFLFFKAHLNIFPGNQLEIIPHQLLDITSLRNLYLGANQIHEVRTFKVTQLTVIMISTFFYLWLLLHVWKFEDVRTKIFLNSNITFKRLHLILWGLEDWRFSILVEISWKCFLMKLVRWSTCSPYPSVTTDSGDCLRLCQHYHDWEFFIFTKTCLPLCLMVSSFSWFFCHCESIHLCNFQDWSSSHHWVTYPYVTIHWSWGLYMTWSCSLHLYWSSVRGQWSSTI